MRQAGKNNIDRNKKPQETENGQSDEVRPLFQEVYTLISPPTPLPQP